MFSPLFYIFVVYFRFYCVILYSFSVCLFVCFSVCWCTVCTNFVIIIIVFSMLLQGSRSETTRPRAHEMRLRFLGAPHVSKSSHLVVDSAAQHKEELVEAAEAKTTSPSTSATDVASVHQLRQRRVGVGLWAIRRQKMERAAQLRPRIVVHMSRLRGRKTAANFGVARLNKKYKLHQAASASDTPRTVTTDDTTPVETRNGAIVAPDTGMDAANGFKVERPEEDGAGQDDVDNSQMRDKENDGKPSGDAVSSRPKRHIMHKKLVVMFASLNN